jgi:hypothetical protein
MEREANALSGQQQDGFISFVLVSWGGVRLSPLGTASTVRPIVPAPDDR